MKKARIIGVITAAALTLVGTAFAGIWSPYVQIANLETTANGYDVYPAASAGNPNMCVDASPISGYTGTSAVEKDLMNKTLLSAFLANRKVRLEVASTVCSGGSDTTGHPVYLHVRVDYAN